MLRISLRVVANESDTLLPHVDIVGALMAVVAHFAEDGGNCGRRRHRGEVLGEVGKRMSAKSGPASRREGAGEPFRNVWSLVSLHRCFIVTQGIIGSRPGPPAVLCIIRIILYYLLIRIMYCRTLGDIAARGCFSRSHPRLRETTIEPRSLFS